MLMELNMKVNGKMMIKMEKEHIIMKTLIKLLEISKMESQMENVFICFQMMINMKEIS